MHTPKRISIECSITHIITHGSKCACTRTRVQCVSVLLTALTDSASFISVSPPPSGVWNCSASRRNSGTSISSVAPPVCRHFYVRHGERGRRRREVQNATLGRFKLQERGETGRRNLCKKLGNGHALHLFGQLCKLALELASAMSTESQPSRCLWLRVNTHAQKGRPSEHT